MGTTNIKQTFILLVAFVICGVSSTFSQKNLTPFDSLTIQGNSDSITFIDNTHDFKIREVIIPTAIVGATTAFVYDNWFGKQKKKVQNALSAQGRHKFKADDYIQYLPMVATYGLNFTKVKGKHKILDRTIILAMSYATMGILVNGMKYAFREKRPDTNSRNSFPSGHTATAFMGAEFLYKEYKDVSPWIGYGGFAIAALTGYLRIYNNRHYINDVIAGACIGILSTKIAYWIYPKIFKKSRCRKAQDKVMVLGTPFYSSETVGLNMCMTF